MEKLKERLVLNKKFTHINIIINIYNEYTDK